MLDNSSAQENSGTEKVSLRQGQLEIIIYEENELQSLDSWEERGMFKHGARNKPLVKLRKKKKKWVMINY